MAENLEIIYEEDSKNAPLDATHMYLKQIGQYDLLTPEEEIKLAKEAQAGDVESRTKLVSSNLRLVVSVAKKYHKNVGMSFLDIIQEGNIGLMKSVDKYDPASGYRFSTYATWWIRQTISRAITNQANTIRVPAHMFDIQSKVSKASQKLHNELGREATIEEIANELNVSTEKVEEVYHLIHTPMSLDYTVGEDDDTSVGDLIADTEAISPEEVAIQQERREAILKVLNTLSEKEKEVIMWRFGLTDGEAKTLEEVGAMYGVTKERIRQIEIKALRKLRQPFRQALLKPHLD
jgi:RNA polymerase primary sigma factor